MKKTLRVDFVSEASRTLPSHCRGEGFDSPILHKLEMSIVKLFVRGDRLMSRLGRFLNQKRFNGDKNTMRSSLPPELVLWISLKPISFDSVQVS